MTLDETRAWAAEWRRKLEATGVDFGDSTELIAEDRMR
jgi:hypothetical protein